MIFRAIILNSPFGILISFAEDLRELRRSKNLMFRVLAINERGTPCNDLSFFFTC